MPMFSYVCTRKSCGHQVEKLQKYEESEEKQICEVCNKGVLQKLITKANIVFKGKWYKTTKGY